MAPYRTPAKVLSLQPANPDPSPSSKGQLFPQTQWSVISHARGDEEETLQGLHRLVISYWKPLYLYLCKRGESHADACDIVQGFFEHVVSGNFLTHVDREGGRFRSYLLKSLERWKQNLWRKNAAHKRGGHIEHVSIQEMDAFREESAGMSGDASPEQAYDQQWAAEIVELAVAALEARYEERGRTHWFQALRASLPGGTGISNSDTAAELGTSEGAVRKGVHDLRKAFGDSLREQIRSTVRSNEEAEDELRYLISIITSQ